MSDIATIAKCLNLAFKQRLLKEDNIHVMEVVTGALETIRTDDATVTSDRSLHAVVEDLKSYAVELMSTTDDIEHSLESVGSNIKLLTLGNADIRSTIMDMLEDGTESKPKIKKAIARDLASIEREYNKKKLENTLYSAYKELRAGKSKIDISNTVEDLTGTLSTLTTTSSKNRSITDSVDMDSDEQLTTLVTNAQDRYNDRGGLKYGFDKINDFIGGSSRFGDFVLIPASQHMYKTGMSCTIFTHLCRYNEPTVFDKTKKPLLLRITGEDPLTNNIEFMYKQITYTDTKETVEFIKEDIVTISRKVKQKLTETGFSVRMIEVNPNLMTVNDLFALVMELEEEGYEIKAIVFDYLAKINRKGIPNDGIAGSQLRQMYETVRNFMAARKILFITPVQLSTEVDSLRAILPPVDVLKTAIIGSKLDSGKAVMQIVDVCYGVDIIRHDGRSWLHVFRGKLRSSIIVAHDKKSFFLPMPENGMPIPDWEQGVYNLPSVKVEDDAMEEELF